MNDEKTDFDNQVATLSAAIIDLALSKQNIPPIASLTYTGASILSHPFVVDFFNRKRAAHYNATSGVTEDDINNFNKTIAPYTEDFWANELRHLENLQAVEKAEITGRLLKATLQMNLGLDIYLTLCGIVERVPLTAIYEFKIMYKYTATGKPEDHFENFAPLDWQREQEAIPFLVREGLLDEEQKVVTDAHRMKVVTTTKDKLYKLDTKRSLSELGRKLLLYGL